MSELRIFIADDEEPARERLRTLLEDIAPELSTKVVGEARNGIEAIDRLPPSGAQVLLLDIQMPGMGGLEVARHLARLEQPIPGLLNTLALCALLAVALLIDLRLLT